MNAAPVTIGNESERFLFYRGVGDVRSPLRVIRHPDQILDVRIDRYSLQLLDAELVKDQGEKVVGGTPRESLASKSYWKHASRRRLWLLEVRKNGTSAFRRVSYVPNASEDPESLFMTRGTFSDEDFSIYQLQKLRTEMRDALVTDGLFGDEADALINTWELSYFRSPGQRLFFLVPREWTDAVLPLKISAPCEVTRVMVGRIELVTPKHRELIKKIASTPVPDLTDVLNGMDALQRDSSRREDYNALASGRGDSSVLGVPVPAIYQDFLDLGRFRSSILNDALNRADRAETNETDRIRHLRFELIYPGKLKREGEPAKTR